MSRDQTCVFLLLRDQMSVFSLSRDFNEGMSFSDTIKHAEYICIYLHTFGSLDNIFSVYVVSWTYIIFMWYHVHVFCLCGVVVMFYVYVASWTCFMFMWCRGHVLCLCGVVGMFYVYVMSWTCFIFMWYRGHVLRPTQVSRCIYTVYPY